jgi:pimeloyl-ACP methyl ester carboxylesterase
MSDARMAATVALLLAVALLTWRADAVAGTRLAECGGAGQCSCNIAQAVPSCDAWSAETGEPCGILGLQRRCVAVPCGRPGERPCVPLVDHSHPDSCRPGLYADEGGCSALGADGYPPRCGHHGQAPCGLALIGRLAMQGVVVTPCVPGAVLKDDACVAIGSDSTVPPCGGRGEPACTIDQQLVRLTRACEPGLEELYPPLGSCFPHEDLTRPPARSWPPEEAPPGRRSVFLVHGMTGGLDSFSPALGGLAAALGARGHRVFTVDYHADEDTPRSLDLYQWADGRWRLLGVHGRPLAGTTLSIGDVAESLHQAILKAPSGPDVALVGHSMGGLVARTLVHAHYDDLRQAGRRITEVVTLGTPHTGGGFGIPDITTARGLQGVAMCWGLRAIRDPHLRRVSYQACMMDRWHEQRERLPPGQTIDDRDHPQIRWIAVAGGGQLILDRSINAAYEQVQGWLNANLGLALAGQIAELDSDSLVAVSSALGIAVDGCLPHRHEAPEPALSLLVPDGDAVAPRLRRTLRTVDGQPRYSATCFLPASACGTGGSCPHPARLDHTDHRYEGRPEVVAFVVAALTPDGAKDAARKEAAGRRR